MSQKELWKIRNEASLTDGMITKCSIQHHCSKIKSLVAKLGLSDHMENLVDSLIYDLIKTMVIVPITVGIGWAIFGH